MATKKSRPRIGQKRKVNQPFYIDRLPQGVQDDLLYLLSERGISRLGVEEMSALPFSADWRASLNKGKREGFVQWDNLPPDVARLFPGRRLSNANIGRWYDVRILQKREENAQRLMQARELAKSFSAASIPQDREAVINATRDVFFELLSENADSKSRQAAAKRLLALGELQQLDRANDIKERKVAVDERKIAEFEKDAALRRQKLQREVESASKKFKKGTLKVEDFQQLVENTFGFRPKRKPAA